MRATPRSVYDRTAKQGAAPIGERAAPTWRHKACDRPLPQRWERCVHGVRIPGGYALRCPMPHPVFSPILALRTHVLSTFACVLPTCGSSRKKEREQSRISALVKLLQSKIDATQPRPRSGPQGNSFTSPRQTIIQRRVLKAGHWPHGEGREAPRAHDSSLDTGGRIFIGRLREPHAQR